MTEIQKEFRRHLYVYSIFLKNSLVKQMEYRANFFMMMAIESTFLVIKILYAFVVYQTGVFIGGFSPDAVLLFIGTFVMLTGIYLFFFYFNFSNLPQLIRDGSLDLYLTKPVSLQFMVSLRNADLGTPVPNIVGGLLMVISGWSRVGIPVNLVNIAGYLGLMVSGTVIGYSIMFAPQLLCFWTIKTNALREIIDNLWDFNNMPMNIYTKWMQRAGVFVFPIFMVSNFAPLFVLKKLSPVYLVWSFLASGIFFLLVRLLWKFCIKNYSSASS